jgi:methylmalonyl-CoA decarboxylase subunit alpha
VPEHPDPLEQIAAATSRALAGNLETQGPKLEKQNKLFVRDRLDLLLDPGSFVEQALLANNLGDDLPADG